MYVIKRADKEYGDFSKTHDTEGEAIIEADRLATKHVIENPIFIIYELKKIKTVSSTVLITRS